MPIKTFTDGTSLPASDLNGFLMNQTVMVFASAAARTSAIPSPTQGMVTYLSDSNSLFVWNGSAWVGAVNTGSLNGYTGVTYADVAITMNTTLTYRMVTIPNSKIYLDIVSIVPMQGTNDTVYLEGVILGAWSGVQTAAQANLFVRLGNAVASTTGYVRFYFRSV